MTNPENLRYTKSHEWVAFTSDTAAKVGLTDYAQQSLGGIVFVSLPEEGDAVVAGENLGDVESVKAVSDIVSPVSGRVSAINESLLDAPEQINEAPYDAWLAEISDITDQEALMDAAAYAAYCAENE